MNQLKEVISAFNERSSDPSAGYVDLESLLELENLLDWKKLSYRIVDNILVQN
jgi:hypothetical protein